MDSTIVNLGNQLPAIINAVTVIVGAVGVVAGWIGAKVHSKRKRR